MKIEKYLPSEALKPYIRYYLIIQSDDGAANKLLPDTSIVLAFRYRGVLTDESNGTKEKLPASLITGIRTSPRLITYSPNAAALLVSFHPGGASAFFREPLHEIFGQSLSLNSLISTSLVNEIQEQLEEAEFNADRINAIEQFLRGKLNHTQTDRLICHAVQQIQTTNGTVSIKGLLNTLPLSRDPFEKRFRRIVGTSPKQFSSIVRLRSIIDGYSSAGSLTTAALSAGYFDQAHFIKDFRLHTDQSPQDFFKSNRSW